MVVVSRWFGGTHIGPDRYVAFIDTKSMITDSHEVSNILITLQERLL